MSHLSQEVAQRRTFAIISHPDAGKTTITEKVLLFGHALQRAGTVKGKKSGQHVKSDWMEMEKERGISVTTSVMQVHQIPAIRELHNRRGYGYISLFIHLHPVRLRMLAGLLTLDRTCSLKSMSE